MYTFDHSSRSHITRIVEQQQRHQGYCTHQAREATIFNKIVLKNQINLNFQVRARIRTNKFHFSLLQLFFLLQLVSFFASSSTSSFSSISLTSFRLNQYQHNNNDNSRNNSSSNNNSSQIPTMLIKTIRQRCSRAICIICQ